MSDYEEENASFTESDHSSETEEYFEDDEVDEDDEDDIDFAKSDQRLSAHSAVLADDVERLKQLIESGKSLKSVNMKSRDGDTLLHLAVRRNKIKVFEYLLTVDNVKMEARNLDDETPLFVALDCANDYCALKLVEKGANVNAIWNPSGMGRRAVSKSLNAGHILSGNGADSNAWDHWWKTPIHVAYEKSNYDMIHMLLYYGADVSIVNSDGFFDLILLECPEPQLQEIFFDYVFDQKKNSVKLGTLITAMRTRSPLFTKIIDLTSEVLYDESDLISLMRHVSVIDSSLFKVFFEKCEEVVKDMILMDFFYLTECCVMGVPNKSNSQNFVDFLYLLCDSPYISTVVQRSPVGQRFMRFIVHQKISEDTLTKLVCCLLSHGFSIVSDDLNSIYERHGFCELFKIMLHMDHYEYYRETYPPAVMPTLIHDVSVTEKYLAEPEKCMRGIMFFCELQQLIKFFTLSKLKKYCLEHYADNEKLMNIMNNMRTVPSLLELGRNAARKYIIRKYNVKKSVHFFTVLKWLPISNVHMAILSYEKEMYRI